MSEWLIANRGVAKSASLTTVGGELKMDCDGAAGVLVQAFSSTATGARLVAEVRTSDDAPWMLTHVMPTNDATPATPILETAVFAGVPAFGWRVDLQGASSFRVRVSAITGGAMVLQAKLSEEAYL